MLYAQEGLRQAGISCMALQFLPDGPALVIENTVRVLVIADLHIGIESDLDVHGVHIPSQTRGRLDRVLACIDEGKPDLVILLGDVKHSVPLTTRQEYSEIPDPAPGDPVSCLSEGRARKPRRGSRAVPGARGGAPCAGCPHRRSGLPSRSYVPGSLLLMRHLLVIGHHHPMVSLRDEVGCGLRDRAYLLTTVDEGCLGIGGDEGGAGTTRVLVMPAFNEFTGFDLTRMQESNLGPLSRCMDFVNAEVFLTDGTYLGLLGSLGEE